MANIAKMKRDRMLAFLEELKATHMLIQMVFQAKVEPLLTLSSWQSAPPCGLA